MAKKNQGFVTGFLGRRDGYQVPLALAERRMLGRFVTGVYQSGLRARFAPWLPEKIQSALSRRRCAGIPEELVDSRWTMEVIQNVSRLCGDTRNRSWAWANRAVSESVRDVARRRRDHLLLYEPYAWEAFTARYDHQPRKVLFHFHLHPVFERQLIGADARHHPMPAAWKQTDAKFEDDARVAEVWRHADLVLCASSFTKRSLVEQGLAPQRCAVVPYGISFGAEEPVTLPPKHFSALFVGSGIQRKGLHHLLHAWSQARLPREASLTVVCRALDPVLNSLLNNLPGNVRLLRGASEAELGKLFQRSALFVMPSLLEGFGQVYLEALARGCPVLGTRHTCLPDLGGEADGVFLVEPGNVPALVQRLEQLAETLTVADARSLRESAARLARRHTWAAFRSRLVDALAGVTTRE